MNNDSEEYPMADSQDPFAATSGKIIYQKQHKINIYISEKPGIIEKLPQQE